MHETASPSAIRLEIPAEERGGAIAVKISNLVVQLFRTHTGRGPTKSRTSIEANLITVVLRDTLTSGERNLVASGQAELVTRLRGAYQRMMQDELIAGVEELTQRKVSALLSDNHVDPDVAVEVFVLEPAA
ncbi:MAG: Na-translocating system protein MpsC family protein [Solirubrobacteraceae bacterium]